MPISAIQQKRIEDCIEFRFFSCLRMSWIIDWVNNFDISDQDMAISVLEHIDYYRPEDISTILMQGVDELRELNRKLHFVGVGKAGKSGGHILYYIQNIFKSKQYKYIPHKIYWSIEEIDCATLTANDEIVFVDDIIGSGNTQYKELVNAHLPLDRVFGLSVLCVIVNEKGQSLLNRKIPGIKILGEVKHDAFDLEKRLFGTQKRTKEIREFCYKYGLNLDKTNPLGYGNSQMLIIFSHAVPNNTLPIIWKETPKWKAVVPRSHFIRNARALNNRNENTRWLFGLKKLFNIDSANPQSLYGTDNYALLYIIRSLHKGKAPTVIANEMGLTSVEYERILQEAILRKLCDSTGKLTEIAVSEIDQLVKRLKYSTNEKYGGRYTDEDELFIPETFRGLK